MNLLGLAHLEEINDLQDLEDLEDLRDSDRNGCRSDVCPTQSSRYVSVGELICGKYLVEKVLGAGGMAFVLSARHIELDQHFAIKFLNADFLQEKVIVERFMREAKAACKIRNEHVAHVHDVGSYAGAPFIVMEHLTGKDLAAVLAEKGQLPIEDVAEYIIQACEALAVAHSHGIVHRDIKPENLFLVGHEGPPTIKLLDFGISKMNLGEGCSTLTGHLSLGTPYYMSPEQIRSTAEADPRSDLWSLGAVLYELLTGSVAFNGESVTELCAAVLETEPVPVELRRPEVPPELCAIVAKCLAKEPSERWENAAELAFALLPFAPSRSIVSAERCSSVTKVPSATPSGQVVPTSPSIGVSPSSRRSRTPKPYVGVHASAAPLPPIVALRPKWFAGVSKVTVLFSLAFAALGAYSLNAARSVAGKSTSSNGNEPVVAIHSATGVQKSQVVMAKASASEAIASPSEQKLPESELPVKNRRVMPIAARGAVSNPSPTATSAVASQGTVSAGSVAAVAPPVSSGSPRIELGY